MPTGRPSQIPLNLGAVQPKHLILMGALISHMLPAGVPAPAAAEQVRQLSGSDAVPAVGAYVVASRDLCIIILPMGDQQIRR